MLLRLFLLFIIVPAVELYLLIRIGEVVGAVPTVILLLCSGMLGASLAKREGWSLIQQIQADLAQGLPPADRLIEGLLVLIGAALLITPGVLTDLTGLLIIFPPFRRRLAPRLKGWLVGRLLGGGGGVAFTGQGFSFRMGGDPSASTEGAPQEPEPDHRPRFDHPVA